MGDPITNIIWLSLAIVAVVALTVWWLVFVFRLGTMSPMAAAKYRRRQEARGARENEKILQAHAKLDAQGWKP